MNQPSWTLENPLVRSISLDSLFSTSTSEGVPISDHSSLSQNEESILKTPVKKESHDSNQNATCHGISSFSDSKLHLLWPQPQQLIQFNSDHFCLHGEIQVQVFPCRKHSNERIQDLVQVWISYESLFEKLNYSLKVVPSSMNSDDDFNVSCQINSALLKKSESYTLSSSSKQLRIVANSLQGLHHAARTFYQLLALYNQDSRIPSLYIYDWPVIPYRALLMNLSFDAARTLTFETLKHLVDCYSRLKFNQLHLYVKFSHLDGWQLPYSQIELRTLVEYCITRGISIVPAIDVTSNLNIQDLVTIYSSMEQFLISVDTFEYVHIGSHLGKLLTDATNGTLQNISKYLPLDQDQALFISWENTLHNIHAVPFNIVPVNFRSQGFNTIDQLPNDELKIGYCTATRMEAASSCCFTGCPKTTISDIHRRIQKCACYRNLAVIIGDAKDSKMIDCTPLAFFLPGMLAAIGLAWNVAIPEDYLEFQIPQLLNQHVVLDTEELTGQIIIELGRAEFYVHRAWSENSFPTPSILWQFFVDPDEVNLEKLTVDTFQKAMRHIKHCQQQLHRTKLSCFQSGELVAELQLTVDLLLLSCRIGRSLVSLGLNPNDSFGVSVINAGVNNLPPTSRTDLANKLLGLTEQFRAIWLSRHLPSGLHTPLLLFTSLLQKLVPDETNDA